MPHIEREISQLTKTQHQILSFAAMRCSTAMRMIYGHDFESAAEELAKAKADVEFLKEVLEAQRKKKERKGC